MKRLFLLLIASVMLFSCSKVNLNDELPSTQSFAKKDKGKTSKYEEPYNAVVFDSCRNENVVLTGTETYSLTESTENGFYINYEIDLERVTGVGEISGITYKGGGKILGVVTVNEDGSDVKGTDTYKVKYNGDNGAKLIFTQKVKFIMKNNVIKCEFNNINDACK